MKPYESRYNINYASTFLEISPDRNIMKKGKIICHTSLISSGERMIGPFRGQTNYLFEKKIKHSKTMVPMIWKTNIIVFYENIGMEKVLNKRIT